MDLRTRKLLITYFIESMLQDRPAQVFIRVLKESVIFSDKVLLC